MNRLKRQRFSGRSSTEHRWMISYADFLTLLFAFFVFLFSISSIQNDKFKEVGATLLQVFDVRPSSIEPIELEATPQGPDVFNPLFQPEPLPGTRNDLQDTETYHQQSSLIDIQAQMGESFSQLIEQQLFSVSGDEEWIEIQIADSITFLPGSADITNEAEAVLYEIAKLLTDMNLPVSVEGYSSPNEATDENDGWQLSAERAANVTRYLQRAGIQGQRLSSVAFAYYQPIDGASEVQEAGKIAIVVAGFGVRSANQ